MGKPQKVACLGVGRGITPSLKNHDTLVLTQELGHLEAVDSYLGLVSGEAMGKQWETQRGSHG